MLQKKLITKCPKCGDLFEITALLLNTANGFVQCSSCEHIFNSVFHLQSNQRVKRHNAVFSLTNTNTNTNTNTHLKIEKKYVDHIDFSDVKTKIQQESTIRKGKKMPQSLQVLLFFALIITLLTQFYCFFQVEIHAIPMMEKIISIYFQEPTQLPLYLSQLELVHEHDNFEKKENNRLLFQGVIVNNAVFTQAVPRCFITLKNQQGQVIFQKTYFIELVGITRQEILANEQQSFDLEFTVNEQIYQETQRYNVVLK